MTVWQPGMRCVCIAKRDREWALQQAPKDYPYGGEVLTVRAVNVWPEHTLLRFEEHQNDHLAVEGQIEPGFKARYFRPLAETRLDQFRKHLNRIPTDRVPA